MMPNKIYLKDEFNKFWGKIDKGENFALLRHGDGERSVILGKPVLAQEGWESPSYITKLGNDCLAALTYTVPNYFVGISCPCCDRASYYWYSSRIPHKNVTFANLWVNGNYRDFYKRFNSLKRDAVVIANASARNRKIGDLNILKFYGVGDDCISFWEQEADALVNSVIRDFGTRKNLLYVISAGPMAGPIIKRLYDNNPDNCYIDFGSSLDEFVHNRKTRPYMTDGTSYAKQNCWMFDPKETSFDVTCVCNMYKRPDSLVRQVVALENQTLKPKEILLYQDGIAGNEYKIELLDSLKMRFSNIRIASENTGVWERFRFARNAAKSPYVCIFDDDTIPGERWLENCHYQMMIEEGVYGTNGIVLKNTKGYPKNGFFNVGWHGPVTRTTQVDFVGHSWFFPKGCLDYMFDGTEQFQSLKYVGEDMCLSVKAQEHGIRTFVPPHPCKDKSLWGSTPLFGNIFGHSAEALSMNMSNLEKMRSAISQFVQAGWEPLCLTNWKLCRTARLRVLRGRISEIRYALTSHLRGMFGHSTRK